MEIAAVHQTAFGAARMRALHLLVDGDPKIFVDDLAIRLTGDDPSSLVAGAVALPFSSAAWVLRSRFTEDQLAEAVARGVRQYVLLGAGLDSFAYRHATSLGSLSVYEVDDPPLQAWKRNRLSELGIQPPKQCVYVPCDFESRSLEDVLADSGFRSTVPTLVSWLGVTQYLTPDAIDQTLRWVAGLAAGAELVLTYVVPEEDWHPTGRKFHGRLRAGGVPFNTFYTPKKIEAVLVRAGFEVQHLTLDEANARYFSGRTDSLRAPSLERLVLAMVPSTGRACS